MRAAFQTLLSDRIEWSAFLSRDAYASVSYADPQSLPALVQWDTERIIERDGRDTIPHGTIFLDVSVPIDIQDQITLADGTSPDLITVRRITDPVTGTPHHYEVTF